MGIQVGKTPKERVYKCDHKGCKVHKRSFNLAAQQALAQLKEEGWYVDPASSKMYCPQHIPDFDGPQVLRVLRQGA